MSDVATLFTQVSEFIKADNKVPFDNDHMSHVSRAITNTG